MLVCPPLRPSRTGLAALVLLLPLPDPGLVATRPDPPPPGLRQEAERPSITPRAGPVGTEVTVQLPDLPPGSPMLVGFGAVGAGYEMVGEGRADEDGLLTVTARVPAWAEPDRRHFFFVAYTDQRPRSLSPAFHVTGADGILRVEGTILSVHHGCGLLETEDETVYGVVGEIAGLEAGDPVAVEGRPAASSSCGEGLAIQVPPGGAE